MPAECRLADDGSLGGTIRNEGCLSACAACSAASVSRVRPAVRAAAVPPELGMAAAAERWQGGWCGGCCLEPPYRLRG